MIDMIKGVMTRTKETDIEKADRQISSLTNDIETIQQKIADIDKQIDQLVLILDHQEHTEKDLKDTLEKARYRLSEAREKSIEPDATRELARLDYLQTLEADLARLEQEIPAQLERLDKSGDEQEVRHCALYTEKQELREQLAALLHDRQVLQLSRNDMHMAEGCELYDQLLQAFNATSQKERSAAVELASLKQELAQKSGEAQETLRYRWPALARKFEQETMHVLRISQNEVVDSTPESLKLARARRAGGMVVGEETEQED
jgi:chromosome segregation ATPase